MQEFKFAIGDYVGTLNDATYGHVVERILHEFPGGSRRTYYYHARTTLPDGTMIPPALLEAYEDELKLVGAKEASVGSG